MKKIFLIILQLFFIIAYSFANQDKTELIKKITIGSEKGELNYIEQPGWKEGPRNFIISSDYKIYVDDGINQRIVIFDMELNYLNQIKHNSKYLDIEYMSTNHIIKVDEFSNIIINRYPIGIIKYDNQGNELLFIELNKMKVRSDFWMGFYPLENKIFYYNDNSYILNFIDEKGNIILDMEKSKKTVDKLNGVFQGISFQDDTKQKQFVELVKRNNNLFVNGKFLIASYKNFLEFRAFTKNIFNYKDNKQYLLKEIKFPINLGFDKNSNYYWKSETVNQDLILIFSSIGRFINFITCHKNSEQAVAPNGDIYLMKPTPDGIFFYRIRNTWNTIDTTEIPNTATPCKALAITATSFIDWKNTYTPAKAFDGNLKTGWLEASKGPGTDESITLTLDKEITVDEIVVAPGYFNPKWWKSNNRIRDLRIKYGKTSQVLYFKDEMKMQKAKLPKEIRFSEITFEIVKVYTSGKDNDTGISEIEFYYKGEKVVINVSG